MRHCLIAIFLFVLEMQNGNGFELVANSNQQDEFSVGLGKTFYMECRADSHYEYCIFEHKGNKVLSFQCSLQLILDFTNVQEQYHTFIT